MARLSHYQPPRLSPPSPPPHAVRKLPLAASSAQQQHQHQQQQQQHDTNFADYAATASVRSGGASSSFSTGSSSSAPDSLAGDQAASADHHPYHQNHHHFLLSRGTSSTSRSASPHPALSRHYRAKSPVMAAVVKSKTARRNGMATAAAAASAAAASAVSPLANGSPKEHGDANKRKRIQQACKSCGVKRVKCDGQQPCQTCRRTGELCEYGQPKKRGPPKGSTRGPNKARRLELGKAPSASSMERRSTDGFDTSHREGNDALSRTPDSAAPAYASTGARPGTSSNGYGGPVSPSTLHSLETAFPEQDHHAYHPLSATYPRRQSRVTDVTVHSAAPTPPALPTPTISDAVTVSRLPSYHQQRPVTPQELSDASARFGAFMPSLHPRAPRETLHYLGESSGMFFAQGSRAFSLPSLSSSAAGAAKAGASAASRRGYDIGSPHSAGGFTSPAAFHLGASAGAASSGAASALGGRSSGSNSSVVATGLSSALPAPASGWAGPSTHHPSSGVVRDRRGRVMDTRSRPGSPAHHEAYDEAVARAPASASTSGGALSPRSARARDLRGVLTWHETFEEPDFADKALASVYHDRRRALRHAHQRARRLTSHDDDDDGDDDDGGGGGDGGARAAVRRERGAWAGPKARTKSVGGGAGHLGSAVGSGGGGGSGAVSTAHRLPARQQRQQRPRRSSSPEEDMPGVALVEPKIHRVTVLKLFDVFWDLVFSYWPVVYKPFFRQPDGAYYMNESDHPLLFNAICALAAASCVDEESLFQGLTPPEAEFSDGASYPTNGRELSTIFYIRARYYLLRSNNESSMETIAALIYMSLYQSGTGRSVQAAQLAGSSCRMALDLGLHRHSEMVTALGDRLTTGDDESCRRLYWGCYVLDKVCATSLGRPPALRDLETDCPMPTPIDEVDSAPLSEGTVKMLPPHAARAVGKSPLRPTQFFNRGIVLGRIVEQILACYNTNKAKLEPHERDQPWHVPVLRLHEQLEDWRRELPEFLDMGRAENRLPHSLCINMWYQCIRIILHRPHILKRADDVPGMPAPHAVCTDGTRKLCELLQLYEELYKMRKITSTIIYCLFTAATISIANTTSDSPALAHEAKVQLRQCKGFLSKISETWTMASHHLAILERLAQGIDADVDGTGLERQASVDALADEASPQGAHDDASRSAWQLRRGSCAQPPLSHMQLTQSQQQQQQQQQPPQQPNLVGAGGFATTAEVKPALPVPPPLAPPAAAHDAPPFFAPVASQSNPIAMLEAAVAQGAPSDVHAAAAAAATAVPPAGRLDDAADAAADAAAVAAASAVDEGAVAGAGAGAGVGAGADALANGDAQSYLAAADAYWSCMPYSSEDLSQWQRFTVNYLDAFSQLNNVGAVKRGAGGHWSGQGGGGAMLPPTATGSGVGMGMGTGAGTLGGGGGGGGGVGGGATPTTTTTTPLEFGELGGGGGGGGEPVRYTARWNTRPDAAAAMLPPPAAAVLGGAALGAPSTSRG